MIRIQVHGSRNHFRFLYPSDVSTEKTIAPSSNCSVCLEEMRTGQTLWRLVHCGHVFHKDCAEEWIARAPNCPMCRTRVGTPPPSYNNVPTGTIIYEESSSSESDDSSSDSYEEEDV